MESDKYINDQLPVPQSHFKCVGILTSRKLFLQFVIIIQYNLYFLFAKVPSVGDTIPSPGVLIVFLLLAIDDRLDEGHIYMTLVLNEACSGFLKTETRSLSDALSLGIVTLCGVRFHVREISLTQRHLSSICKAS